MNRRVYHKRSLNSQVWDRTDASSHVFARVLAQGLLQSSISEGWVCPQWPDGFLRRHPWEGTGGLAIPKRCEAILGSRLILERDERYSEGPVDGSITK